MRLLIALFLLATSAFGSVMEIDIKGVLNEGEHYAEFFGLESAPFVLTFRYDDDEEDYAPNDATEGLYYSEQPVTMDFGTWHFQSTGTTITVLSDAAGFWGFTFGNTWEMKQNGLTLPEYVGLYASFVSSFDPSIAPDDSLHWVADKAGVPVASDAGYAMMFGDDAEIGSVRFEQSRGLTYAVRDIPEPSAILLAMAGLLWFSNKKFNK